MASAGVMEPAGVVLPHGIKLSVAKGSWCPSNSLSLRPLRGVCQSFGVSLGFQSCCRAAFAEYASTEGEVESNQPVSTLIANSMLVSFSVSLVLRLFPSVKGLSRRNCARAVRKF